MYTYLIGWSRLDKWYYGCRWAKNSTPKDLWKTYFTSSKFVKQFREEYGEPDVIQIRKTFDCKHKCKLWEEKVLLKLKVVNQDKWLNQTDNKNFYNKKELTEEHKNKIRVSSLGRKHKPDSILKMQKPKTLEHREKISMALKDRIFTEETKQKIKEKRKFQIFTEDTRKKLSLSSIGNTKRLGKKHSEETKQKMRASRQKYLNAQQIR